jgi:hypothetical protein
MNTKTNAKMPVHRDMNPSHESNAKSICETETTGRERGKEW